MGTGGLGLHNDLVIEGIDIILVTAYHYRFCLCSESTSCAFPFSDGFFYLVTTGCIMLEGALHNATGGNGTHTE